MKRDLQQLQEGLILNVNKPVGITSFDVIRKLRRSLKIRKMGHAGTLDPFAAGVLIILIGKATKRFEEFAAFDKQYLAEIEFGVETDTFDISGKVIERHSLERAIPEEEIENILWQFTGEIDQIPPVFSALKHKGRPLYTYARKGVEVQPPPRRVRIDAVELVHYDWPRVWVDIVCSKGTYIRSLASDIGKKAGTGACLRSLIRTRIGPYRIEDAYHLDVLTVPGKALEVLEREIS